MRRKTPSSNQNTLLMIGFVVVGLVVSLVTIFPNQFNSVKDLINAAGKNGGATWPFGTSYGTYDTGILGPTFTEPDGSRCYGEDSSQERTWNGDLAPNQEFNVTLPLCDDKAILTSTPQCTPSTPCDIWDPGGTGFMVRLSNISQPITLQVTDPKGNTYDMHVSQPSRSSYVQERCFVPAYFHGTISDKYGLGSWSVKMINGTSASNGVNLYVWVGQAYPQIQQGHWRCPQADWNFVPPVVIPPINPLNGSSALSGVVNINVKNAVDPNNIVEGEWNRAYILITGRAYAAELISPIINYPNNANFTLPWNTTTVKNGTYTLTSEVRSPGYGPIKAAPITVSVKN